MGGVAADAGQGEQGIRTIGQGGAVVTVGVRGGNYGLRGLVQIAGAGIIAEALPRFEYEFLRGGGQGFEGGKAGQEGVVEACQYCGNLRIVAGFNCGSAGLVVGVLAILQLYAKTTPLSSLRKWIQFLKGY